jgi:hypothetical protein
MSMIIDGTNGLTFNNATTQASAGVVLQVVSVNYSTQTTTTNTAASPVATGLTTSITPKFTTSKILILISHNHNYKPSGFPNADIAFWLYKNGSNLIKFAVDLGYTGSSLDLFFSSSFIYLDSPATTSSVTYSTYFANANAGGGTISVQSESSPSTITLMEIAG